MTLTMNSQDDVWFSLIERLRATLDRRDDVGTDTAEALLPASVYCDPARFEAEKSELFRRMPVCLGHADQLHEPGSVLAREVVGLPLLLVRDAQGGIGVFLNACRHRGARLVAEDELVCQRSSLSCPYHGWTYDLGGALAAVPRQDAFRTLDRATRGLRRLPSTCGTG